MSDYNQGEQEPHPYGQFRVYTLPFAPQGQPQAPAVEMPPMSPAVAHNFHIAKLRNIHASARSTETRTLIDGMREIRDALGQASISEGDKGGDGRPPLDAGFDEINRGKLQLCYLRLAERLCNYVDHTIEKQLDIPITNEIKK